MKGFMDTERRANKDEPIVDMAPPGRGHRSLLSLKLFNRLEERNRDELEAHQEMKNG